MQSYRVRLRAVREYLWLKEGSDARCCSRGRDYLRLPRRGGRWVPA